LETETTAEEMETETTAEEMLPETGGTLQAADEELVHREA